MADQGAHADPFRQTGHARLEPADAAHYQVDPNAGLRGSIQGVDDLGIDQVVDLDHDSPFRPHCLVLDQLDQSRAQRRGRDEQLAIAALPAVAGEVVEQLGDVRSHIRVGGEQRDVLERAGSRRVVVARGDVRVTPDAFALLPHDEHQLGVCLEADQAVHDVDARSLERFGPLDIGLLVPRAFNSTSATTCLPDWAAVFSATAMGLSGPDVLYIETLIARTSLSRPACSAKASTDVTKESYG